jgi:hypothetical protein
LPFSLLDQIEHLVLACQHEVVETQQHFGAFTDRPRCPVRLDCTRACRCGGHIAGRPARYLSERFARHRVRDRHDTTISRLHLPGQVIQRWRYLTAVVVSAHET